MIWEYTKQELDTLLDVTLPLLEKQIDVAHDRYSELCRKRGRTVARIQEICSHDEATYYEDTSHTDTLGNCAGWTRRTYCSVCKKKLKTEDRR